MSRPMTIYDAAAYLVRFDAVQEAIESRSDPVVTAQAVDAPGAAATPSLPDEESAVAQRRAFDAEMAAALDAQATAHAQALVEARETWATDEGAALKRCLYATIEGAFEKVREDIARILAPFVSGRMEEKALGELTAAISRGVAHDRKTTVDLFGPQEVIGSIGRSIADENIAVRLHVREAVDIVVELSTTRIETQIEAWMSRVSQEKAAQS